MKKIILTALLLASFYITRACPGSSDTNNPAVSTFNKIFKNVREVSWLFHSQYSFASFTIDQVHIKAWFDKDGKLTRTIRYYKEENLAPFIKLRVNQKYGSWEISGITELSTKNILYYEIVLKKEAHIRVIAMDNKADILSERKYRIPG
ncbi:MAG: hypothetical protein QM594_16860 [Niabella sp.]